MKVAIAGASGVVGPGPFKGIHSFKRHKRNLHRW